MSDVTRIVIKKRIKLKRPLFESKIVCGFPSPADDFVEKYLNPEDLYYQHPASTYFFRVRGDSMIGAGIFPDDILVVDASLQPRNNDIVIATVNGETTCKYFFRSSSQKITLIPGNKKYPNIYVNPTMDLEIFGVVTWVLGQKRR